LSLGKLILTLACKSTSAVANVHKSLEYVAAHYSPELVDFLRFTLVSPINYPTIDELCKVLSTRMLREMEYLQQYVECHYLLALCLAFSLSLSLALCACVSISNMWFDL
jgi:hypothetical protein